MHGQYESSRGRKAVFAAVHLGIVVWVAWLLLVNGAATVLAPVGAGQTEGALWRRMLLLTAGCLYWVRMTLGMFVFIHRRVGWAEVVMVSVWLFVIHTTFALLGAANTAPIGPPLYVGLLLYLLGSVINSGSELRRYQWKRVQSHTGHLYREGLFRYARHINYFGDTVLFTGYALVTGSGYALVIPVIMTAGFLFEHGPKLDRYLESRYGKEYAEWAAKTARFVPWVY